MSINPTWDLFIIIFFGLVITYSFIIGKHETVKIIISTYIAILAVEGIGNIIARFAGDSTQVLATLGLSADPNVITGAKLVIFIALIVLIAIRGGLEIVYAREPHGIVNILLAGVFGAATAGLLLISLFVFALDIPLLDATSIAQAADVAALTSKSRLLELMITNQDLVFSLPALLLIALGLLSNDGDSVE